MSNELELRREIALKTMMDVECMPAVPELDLAIRSAERIPLENLTALGVAFQPLTTAIQTVVNGAGGSGLYYVNTKGLQMFSTPEGYIGSLKNATGTVGGGQARMAALPCDPTMLAMAAVLMNIEKKLDTIQETQEEILEFLVEKERATLQGNLNVLAEVMSNYKYNWTNDTYKHSKIVLIQQIKKESETSIVLYRSQISKKLKKRTSFHSDKSVKEILKDLKFQFSDYQLALYLYSYASFLEVMLEGNFGEGYLNSVEKRILEYSLQYRTLYTECYNLMESYSKSSLQAEVWSGLASASKFMGEAIAKVPVISNSQLDESLIEAGAKLDRRGDKRATAALDGLAQTRMSVTRPFVESIRAVNDLYNKPVTYLFDDKNVYIQRITG